MWRGEYSKGLGFVCLSVLVVVTACAGEGSVGADDSVTVSGSATAEPGGGEETTTTPPPTGGNCEIPPGEPFTTGEQVKLTDLGEIDGVRVRGAVYPHPEYDEELWSQWGQGIVVGDGRFYSAIGDHLGADGNSYVYEYDPASDTLTMVGDVLSHVDHEPGTWGYGKIHSQMVPGPCGEIYFSTYWGSFRDISFEGNYTGDLLFRLDPFGRTLQPLSVPIEFHGQASLAADPASGLIYGEAVDPIPMSDDVETGPFFVYNVRDEEVVFVGPDEPHVGFRSIMVDAAGSAYYSIGGGGLASYDPGTGESLTHDSRLPGDFLRAVTTPGPDGSVYGVTDEPDVFFVMNPDGSIGDLGPALEYTASVALSPDGSKFYHMPGAHGDAPEWGSPLISVDTETGEQTVVVELNQAVQEVFGYTVGGTYDIALSPDGDTLFMGVNVGVPGTEEESFGEVILLVIELP